MSKFTQIAIVVFVGAATVMRLRYWLKSGKATEAQK